MVIYKATNLINGKCYIGKTVHKLDTRKLEHNSCAKRSNDYFHRSIRKYGKDNFKWEIIYECDDELILNVMETMKIIVEHSHVSENNGYNLTWGGDGISGYKHTEESKIKIRESNKGYIPWNKGKIDVYSNETKVKKSNSAKGKKHTEESKQKMSIVKKNISNETRQKMSKSQTGRKHTEETKRKIGNASRKYNDELLSTIKKMLDDGITRRSIADKMCIPYPTINEWIRKYNNEIFVRS